MRGSNFVPGTACDRKFKKCRWRRVRRDCAPGGLIGALASVPLLAGGWEIVRRLYLADD